MRNKPKISIIIPAYNEENFLPRCLKSLSAQQNAPLYEVIVVDNNSSDNTAKVASNYDVVVISESKPGVTYARNAGLKKAKGEIIVSTDADTYFKPDWLAFIGNFFDMHPEYAGLAGHYHFVKGPLWARIWPVLGAIWVKIVYRLTNKIIYVSGVNLSFRKAALPAYNTNHQQGGDEVEALKIILKSGPVFVTLKNAVYTSARRVNQGFLHSMLVTVGYYYMFDYWRTKRSGTESIIGGMPAIRTESRTAHWRLLVVQWGIIIGFGVSMAMLYSHHVIHIWKLSALLH